MRLKVSAAFSLWVSLAATGAFITQRLNQIRPAQSLYFAVLLSILVFGCSRTETKKSDDLLRSIAGAELAFDVDVIDLGTANAHRNLRSGWQEDRRLADGTTITRGTEKSVVAFHSFDQRDQTLQIRCTAEENGISPESVQFHLNGEHLALSSEPNYQGKWILYSVSIPGELLIRGMNHLTISAPENSGLLVDFIRFHRQSPGEQSIEGIQIVKTEDSSIVTAPVQSCMLLHTILPEHPEVEISYALPEHTPKHGAARFSIRIDSDDGLLYQTSEILQSDRWKKTEGTKTFFIKSAFQQIVRISLTATAVAGKPAPMRVNWRQVLVSGIRKSTPAREQNSLKSVKKPNIIIYLIDALRPDFLQPYGYPAESSPRIHQFAKESVLFKNAYAAVSWTRPAVASILSGLYPSSHLTEAPTDVLPNYIPILPQILKQHGYHTFGSVTNPNVSQPFKFTRGYDHYTRLKENLQTRSKYVSGDGLYQHLKELVATRGLINPAFLYVHAMDTHDPYTPAVDFWVHRPECDYMDQKIFRPNWGFGTIYDTNRELVSCVRSLYEGEVRQSDYYFGKFVDLLKENNLYDDSLIILTSDHGESLYEHRIWGHRQSLYESEIRVPLIVRFPRANLAARRINAPVSHVDLLPSILDYVGIPAPAAIQGQSFLASLTDTSTSHERPLFGELLVHHFDWKTVRFGNYKLLEFWIKGMQFYTLHDLSVDPAESVNLSSDKPVLFGFMKQLLRKWAEEQQIRKALLPKEKNVLDKETEESLKALGYLQ